MKVAGPGAKRSAQPRHLDEAAGDQRDAGIGAEAEAVRNPCANGQHVLYGAADLHANHVVGGVGPEHRGPTSRAASAAANAGIAGGHGHRRWQARADFPGERRARQHRYRHVAAEFFRGDFVGQTSGAVLEALGGPGHPGACCKIGPDRCQSGPEGMAGHAHQQVTVGCARRC